MVRSHAFTASAAGLVPFGHMGLAFQDRSELISRAAEYIDDGLRLNQFVTYAGDASPEDLSAELATLPATRELLKSGRINVASTSGYYVFQPGTDVLDSDATLRRYIATAEAAIAAGYSGFRAVVDVTPVARTVEQRDAVTALEFLVHKEMAVLPFSALCAYDTTELGSSAAEMICLHPIIGEGAVDFHIFARPEPEIAFSLAGQIDSAGIEAFRAALNRLWPLTQGDTVRIDATDLEFIGHEHLALLNEHARADQRTAVLLTNQRSPARLIELLNFSSLRVQPVPDKDSAIDGLDEQLDTRAVIEQVQDVLMQSLELTSEQAFATLINISHTSKLLDVIHFVHDELTSSAAKSREAVLVALGTVRERLR